MASEVVEIEDEDVPLGVVDDELVDLEDEDVPLAAGVKMNDNGEGGQSKWPWWLLAVAAAVTGGKVAYDKNKKIKKTKEVVEKVTEDEEK